MRVEPWVVVIVIAAAGALFYIAQRFGWIDLSNKRKTSGSSGGVMGIGDEVFHPTRHEAQIELDRQTVLPAPAPVPGDGDHGIYDGQVRIDLSPGNDSKR
jgi:hypothetical protein